MKKTLIGLCAFMLSLCVDLYAQPTGSDENFYASNGKFYVVVAVLGIIFAGIIFFMLFLDQRLGKLEKEMTKK